MSAWPTPSHPLNTVPTDTLPPPFVPDPPPGAGLALLGTLTPDGLDSLLPGGVYALVPQSPPARYPLWASFLQSACQSGQVCHVLTRSDPADFLQRIALAGWPGAHAAWRAESLRVYAMADGFAKLLFRRDVPGLTLELEYWGVKPQDSVLVDAADALLSLHDMFLATAQLGKLRAWAKDMQIPVLLNFTLAGAGAEKVALTGLMDFFSGLARLNNDDDGPTLTLEYWQSTAGTSAERTVLLQEVDGAYRLRRARPTRVAGVDVPGLVGEGDTALYAPSVLYVSNDPVWAQEMQMLMQSTWKTIESVQQMTAVVVDRSTLVAVLRFDAHAALSALAKDVHTLRVAFGPQVRIVVAEHRVSLRYPNELMLLRLGADAVIRKDVELARWPKLLEGLSAQAPRPQPDLDVDTALANAAMPQGRGFVLVPAFLDEVAAATERGSRLGVPSALAVLKMRADRSIGDAVAHTEFRRNGDFLTSDGEKLYVFFNACSITRGPEVLAQIFTVNSTDYVLGVDWMASQTDMQQCMQRLKQRHQEHPIDVHPAPTLAAELAATLAEAEAEAEAEVEVDGDTLPAARNTQLLPDVQAATTAPADADASAPAGPPQLDSTAPSRAVSPHAQPHATDAAAEPEASETPAASAAPAASATTPCPAQTEAAAPTDSVVNLEPQPPAPIATNPSPTTAVVRVFAVVPHEQDSTWSGKAPSAWPRDDDEAMADEAANGLAHDATALGLDSSAITSSAADVSALIRRLARPAPSNPATGRSPRQTGHY